MKTPISYYGGKQAILGHLLRMVPEHEVYTETFFGGGALFWAKRPVPNETINDKLDIVVNFYRVLKSDYKALKKRIDQSLISRTMHREALAIIRSGKGSPLDRAWAFWMCTNFSYFCKLGGGIKYSNQQLTCVPEVLINKKREFTDLLVRRIEHAYIECGDALKVLRSRNVAGAFHYIDPPYIDSDQGHYDGYGRDDFGVLLDFLAGECKGRFLLSNYNSDILDEYVDRYGWFKREIVHRLKAPRKTGPVKCEVLVYNYVPDDYQEKLAL